jgi:hypothetical protein
VKAAHPRYERLYVEHVLPRVVELSRRRDIVR